MYKFGLACEGITDHIILENVLCGYFEDPELDEEIIKLQPHLDETDQKQKGFGGWEMLLDYLKSERFREDVINVEFLILQLDSDCIEHANFNLSYRKNDGSELTTGELIEKIITKLIEIINLNVHDFYQNNKQKIIFSICVHSIECWLYAYYNTKSLRKPKITGCGKALEFLLRLNGFGGDNNKKNPQLYKQYSKFFLDRKNIDTVYEKDLSFQYFIQLLKKAT